MNKNSVVQVAKIDHSNYSKGLKKMAQDQRATETQISKSAKNVADEHNNNSHRIIKNNFKVSQSVKDMGKQFANNIKTGTVVAGAVAMASTVKNSVQDASRSILDLDKSMSRMQSRFSLSSKKVEELRDKFKKLSSETGINAGAIAAAGEMAMKASGNGEAVGLASIAQASKMGGGEASDITRQVVDALKGSGQDFTDQNVKSFLESASAMTRSGDMELSEAISALSKDSSVKDRLGLSNRENAALIAASSNVGQDRETSLAGLNAILSKAVAGFGQGSALSGILGVDSFMKNGKFDVDSLRTASQNLSKSDLNKADTIELLKTSGMSDDESEGLFSILTDFNEFEKNFNKTIKDQKTLGQAFSEETNNLSDNLSKMNQGLAKATDDILNPLAKTGNDLLKGNFSKAFSELPSNISDSLEGVGENKLAVGASLATLAAAGALTSKLGFGGDGKGLAKGLAVEKATGGEVESVYVVNAKEIADSMNSKGLLDMFSSKGAGKAGRFSKVFGAAKMLATRAVPVLGAGAAGYGAGKILNDLLVSKTKGTTSEGFEGNIVEQLFFKLDKLIGGEGAESIIKAQQATQKVELVVNDKSDRLDIVPKARDLNKNAGDL